MVSMITIKQVQETGRCVFCNRDKEVITVGMEGHPAADIQLCWSDLRRMAHMKMRIHSPQKPVTSAMPLTPVK
jgi:hypothetical protein